MKYTDEEYALLANELSQVFGHVGYTRSQAQDWLNDGSLMDTIEKIKFDMTRMPYEDLPLHINMNSKTGRTVCQWRLKIGR